MERKFFEVKVDASNIKTLSATFHLLQKIGKDVIIEVEQAILTLRALNDNRSAFAAIEFDSNFFDHFILVNKNQAFACKLSIKVSYYYKKNQSSFDAFHLFIVIATLYDFEKSEKCHTSHLVCKSNQCRT